MSSAGGLQKRSKYRAIDSLLSGPAAGVVGAGSIAKSAGFQDFINLDMGGTSTDVSRYSGHYGYQSPHQVGDAGIANATQLKIETVAAGGGSVAWKMDYYGWARKVPGPIPVRHAMVSEVLFA